MEEELRYECRFCGKRFPCGRSLGGHMRSHLTPEKTKLAKAETVVSSSSSCFDAGYALRENPRKTCRFSGESRGSGDHSLLSDSLSDNEAPTGKRRRRSAPRRSNSPSLSGFETEQDCEEVAMCLIMLSRDVSRWNRSLKSADNFSTKPAINGDSDLGLIEKPERRRCGFECLTCNKRFHSYQALGGHRASHRKSRGCFASNCAENSVDTDDDRVKLSSSNGDFDHASKPEKRSRFSAKKSSHECPICFKVFASGQALGGHKRSHVITGSDQPKQAKPVPEIRDFLDLNLPAPDEQDVLAPWWGERGYNKHGALISN